MPPGEVSGHENRIYPIGGRRVDVENTGLVAELDTLHAYVYKNDTGNDTCIVVSAEKERGPCKQNHSATDKVEIAYAYLFYIFSYKRLAPIGNTCLLITGVFKPALMYGRLSTTLLPVSSFSEPQKFTLL